LDGAHLLAAFAVLCIGVSKAGFGGGLGMLTTPLCAMAFGSKEALGIVLPLLCVGDLVSLRYYWGRWDRRNLKYLLPGVVVGVMLGVQLVGRLSTQQLNAAIGLLAVAFVTFQVIKDRIFAAEGAFSPTHTLGVPCGIVAGVTSTLAHGAAPVVSVFLIPQRLAKDVYVGTTVLTFTCINWIKMPFFAGRGILTSETLMRSLILLPLVPVGVWLGVWLNRKASEAQFTQVIYASTFLTGLELMFHPQLVALFR
jgi:uncharacterized membrane protein YfcA